MVGSPHQSTGLSSPHPNIPISYLRNAERYVSACPIQCISHLSICGCTWRTYRIQAAPIIFEKINPPGSIGVRVLLLIPLASGKIVASEGAGRTVNPKLKSFRVQV